MSILQIVASFEVALAMLQVNVHGEPAKPCNRDLCKLPRCFCSGTEIPGNLPVSSIPQIVYISNDAAINSAAFAVFEELFNGTLKNPNGCNISGTFFVSHEYTDYCKVQTLYSQRHEIADNSISRRLPIKWWANATEEELTEEIGGMREILRKWGNVKAEDVKGFRAPYIQIGGNTEFKVLKNLDLGVGMYESSMPTQKFMDPPLWPYTLDYRSIQDCVIPPCPTGRKTSLLFVVFVVSCFLVKVCFLF